MRFCHGGISLSLSPACCIVRNTNWILGGLNHPCWTGCPAPLSKSLLVIDFLPPASSCMLSPSCHPFISPLSLPITFSLFLYCSLYLWSIGMVNMFPVRLCALMSFCFLCSSSFWSERKLFSVCRSFSVISTKWPPPVKKHPHLCSFSDRKKNTSPISCHSSTEVNVFSFFLSSVGKP